MNCVPLFNLKFQLVFKPIPFLQVALHFATVSHDQAYVILKLKLKVGI